jgi:V-type H+-transporting ATPase subunit G
MKERSSADGLDRTKRVKEARDEAKKEIEEYRKTKEEEFKKFEAEVRFLASFTSDDPVAAFRSFRIIDHVSVASRDFRVVNLGVESRLTKWFSSIPAETKRPKKTQVKMQRSR